MQPYKQWAKARRKKNIDNGVYTAGGQFSGHKLFLSTTFGDYADAVLIPGIKGADTIMRSVDARIQKGHAAGEKERHRINRLVREVAVIQEALGSALPDLDAANFAESYMDAGANVGHRLRTLAGAAFQQELRLNEMEARRLLNRFKRAYWWVTTWRS